MQMYIIGQDSEKTDLFFLKMEKKTGKQSSYVFHGGLKKSWFQATVKQSSSGMWRATEG